MIGHEMLVEFSAVVWPALVDHLWQATMVAGLCLLAIPAFRGAGEKSRYILWGIAFARFAVPQNFVLALTGFSNLNINSRIENISNAVMLVAQPSGLIPSPAVVNGPAAIGHSELYCILTIVWITGFAFLLGHWSFRQYKFAKSLRREKTEAGSELFSMLESLKDKLGVCSRTKLQIVWRGSDPGIFGVWRPFLVLPEEMPGNLKRAEMEAVLAHELIHVARRDNLWSNLQMVVCCIFWFYPIIWILDRILIAAREHSCDEHVIGALGNPRAYASALIKMANISLGLNISGFSHIAGHNIKRRMVNMKNANKKAGLPARVLLYSVVVLTILLFLVGTPLRNGMARNTLSNLTIEDSDASPLKIISASIVDITVPAKEQAKSVPARLVNPKILVNNNSKRTVSIYVLEFRKAGSRALYLNRMNLDLGPKGTDAIDSNESLWTAGGEVTGAGPTWTVRIDVIRFKDGSVLTLHGTPFPPPPGEWESPAESPVPIPAPAPTTKRR
jgi:beta-lactamase regulating signal transducer with metallopeptidase domain